MTKDIDLVVKTKNEFKSFQKALKKLMFKEKIPGKEYSRMNLNQIFERKDFRIDLFDKEVCNKFSLTKGIIKRSEITQTLKNLKIKHCSNEDIFLFKTMTEREGDLEDCINIAKTGIEWNTIFNELNNQIKLSKKNVWITWVGERLDILEDRGVEIPIMNKINKLRNEYFEELEKDLSNK